MVCVTTNERTTFCRPSPGGETGGRSQSVHKGIISKGWGKSGCHNHGVLVTGEKSSSEYAECTGPDVPKRVDRPLQNRHKFTFKISKIISSRRASFCLIPTFCDFTKCRDWKCTQSIENTLTRCLKVNHSLELAHSAPCVWTSIIVSAKCSSKKISRKKDTQNRFKLPPPGRSHWIYSARQNRSSSRLTEQWSRHRWGHLDELCRHQVLHALQRDCFSLCPCLRRLPFSEFHPFLIPVLQGLWFQCGGWLGGGGGVGRCRTEIRENACGGFVVAVVLSGV